MSKKDLKEGAESPRGKKEKEQPVSAIETRVFDRLKKNDSTLTGIKTRLFQAKDAQKFFTLLKDNTHVSSVQLSGIGLTDKCCKEAAQALTVNSSVTYLAMLDCALGSEGFVDLGKGVFSNKSLKTLIIGPPALSPSNLEKGLEELMLAIAEGGRMSRLSLLGFKLSNNVGRSLLKVLSRCPLRSLDLSDNQLGDDAFAHIAGGLARSSTLKVLVLNGTNATETGHQTLLKVLHRDNTSLVRLALNNTSMGDSVRAVVEAIEYPNGLRELELSGCKIDNERAALLFRALASSRQLRRLNLADNLIKDISALQLDQSFNIVDLSLAGNQLNDESVMKIARQLPLARSLIRLNLARNPFEMSSAVKIFSVALLMQTPLSKLVLSESADDDSETGLSDVVSQMLARREKLAKEKAKVVDAGGWSKQQISLTDMIMPRDPTNKETGDELDLSLLRLNDSHLQSLVPGINAASLHTLRLCGNSLAKVPALDWPKFAQTMVLLDLSNNRITDLPIAVTVLARLEQLDLRLNLLSAIPSEIAQMTGLKHLLLSHNKITLDALPDALIERRDASLHLQGNLLPYACIQEVRSLERSVSSSSARNQRLFSPEAEREIAELLFNPTFGCSRYELLRCTVESVTTSDEGDSTSEAVLQAVLRLMEHYDVSPAVFHEVLRFQLSFADNPNTCLRRDGPDMWLFSHYLANVCMPFLERTVKPIIARVNDAGKAPITDGTPTDEQVNTKETLQGLTNSLFEAIMRNVELLPAAVGSLVSVVADHIASRWSDKVPARDRQQQMAVASTMFLRLLTPCVIAPASYNVGKKISSKSITKNHLALARHMQAVANGIKPELVHPGMAQFTAAIFSRTLALQPTSRDPHFDSDIRLLVWHLRTHVPRVLEAMGTLRVALSPGIVRLVERLAQPTAVPPLVATSSISSSIVTVLSDSVRSLSTSSSSAAIRQSTATAPPARAASTGNAATPPGGTIRQRVSIGSSDDAKDKPVPAAPADPPKDKTAEESSSST